MRGVVLNERVRVRRQLLKTQREWKRGNPGFTSQKTGAEGEEGEGAGQGTWHARKSASHTQLQMRVVEGKSVWRLPQQQFPFPPTADTMKIVSENNAICRRRVGRNFGVAQFICTVDRELCQGCDVWTTTADLSLCIQPPLFCRKDQTECVLCDNRSICCYYSILSRASKSNTVCLLRQACVFTEICLGLHSLVCLRACVCNCLFSPDLFSIIIN